MMSAFGVGVEKMWWSLKEKIRMVDRDDDAGG